ncbi:phosphoglycerate dehydrogenase [Rhizobiaceae bacterium BDR2-2]|uniref:Phosphoglycerate dehydrogenase n=1 Tax=Ectorhizobium quercum TaxID=2965071 RepID=A0AAE3N113_9HYPH|nr:phosphoglycerate dehydrogenase [Ectorhizobium quercum]MCX8997335.1 phosphoglycerate dehydrogenase [Ectorhizobium quercum]
MTVLLTTSPGFGRHGRVPARLAELGWELIRCTDTARPDGGVSDHIARADYLVVGLVPVTEATLSQAGRLKAVLKHGVGVDNIDIPACTARGIPVANTPGANADAVAELALGLMFSMARAIPASHIGIVSGGWNRQVGSQIGGKILGILGLGNIGRALALKAKALGMTVIATDPYADRAFAEAHSIGIVDLPELLARSHYLSLHVFGGADNAALIDASALSKMKPGARLLNLARGEVTDIDAVYDALQSGQLGGAAFDAYTVEPPDRSHPIFTHPKAVFMPHSGADTVEAVENVGLMNIADIETLIAGGRPARVLNPEVFERTAP